MNTLIMFEVQSLSLSPETKGLAGDVESWCGSIKTRGMWGNSIVWRSKASQEDKFSLIINILA